MADIPEFELPSWLRDQDADTIQQRMMEALPLDIDSTQGGFPWDFTYPTALEKAEMLEFHLQETLKLMHPMWAYGKWLDYHARGVGIERKAANAAAGNLEITGVPGTVIPAGFRFAAPAVGDSPAIEYTAAKDAVIGDTGTAEIEVVAAVAGLSGNIPANTVSLMVSPMKGISKLNNPKPITGGAEQENDDELRQRIDDIYAASDMSFVGCDADYIRWAREVPGVGAASVLPEWDGPGTVKVVVTDSEGLPANSIIQKAVYDYIMSPDDRMERKAPIGAILTVSAPVAKTLQYSVSVTLGAGELLETVIERFKQGLQVYYSKAKLDGVIRYHHVESVLTQTAGVKDFKNLLLNGARENIVLAADEYPVTGEVSAETGASV